MSSIKLHSIRMKVLAKRARFLLRSKAYESIALLPNTYQMQKALLPSHYKGLDAVVTIPLKLIKHGILPHVRSTHPHRGTDRLIIGGDWDLYKAPVHDLYWSGMTSYRSVFQIYRDKLCFTQSDQYKEMVHRLKVDECTQFYDRTYTTCAHIDEYFLNFDKLVHDISLNGFKTQQQLYGSDRRLDRDEMRVAIGRDGSMIKLTGGAHRFALARILDIPIVPVVIAHVHHEWFLRHCPDPTRPLHNELDALFTGAYGRPNKNSSVSLREDLINSVP